MSLIRHCIVNTVTNKVVNVIEYETEQKSAPPGFEFDEPHLLCIANDIASPGWDYIDGAFVDNRPETDPFYPRPINEQLVEAK